MLLSVDLRGLFFLHLLFASGEAGCDEPMKASSQSSISARIAWNLGEQTLDCPNYGVCPPICAKLCHPARAHRQEPQFRVLLASLPFSNLIPPSTFWGPSWCIRRRGCHYRATNSRLCTAVCLGKAMQSNAKQCDAGRSFLH